MTPGRLLAIAGLSLSFAVVATAGPVTPDCSVDKAAKHAAEKSTVGVSTNRCSVGMNHIGTIQKHTENNDSPPDNTE